MIRTGVSILGLATAFLAAPVALAQDVRAATEIESVLVFPDSADITRIGEVSLSAGEHRVIVIGLPESLDANSIRVRFGDEAVVVGSVEAASAYPEGGGPEAAQALRDQLQALQDKIQEIDDRIATAELQLQFLQSQAGPPKVEDGSSISPDDWSSALTAIAAGSRQARADMLAARQERRVLERALEELQLQVDEIDDDLAIRTDVAIALTAERAVTTAMQLEYQIDEAGWGALYDARLDSEAASLLLERKIQVFQNSGEDWSRVRLSVSTAPPTDDLTAPDVYSQYLSLMDPAPPAPRDGYAAGAPAPTARLASEREAYEDIVVTGSRITPVDTVDAAFASTYSVGGLVDVLSDGSPRTFGIGQEDIAVNLVIRAAPRQSLDAFVTAKLTYEGDGPLPPGSLRLYRDGAYLREDYLDTLVPSEEIELGFGVDQQVVVTWVDEGGKESETGLIGRSTSIDENHLFTALNRHSTPFTVEIVDRRPISQDDDIQVRVSPEATPPDEEGFEDAPGVLVWRKELQPDETLAVRNAFTIVYPTSKILVGR
jgi:uncharacterized protein (TIGR02231 family)